MSPEIIFPVSLRKRILENTVSDKNRSQLYLDLIPVMCSGNVELLDNPRMVNELRQLERKVGRSGRDSVDHRPGLHDDLANGRATNWLHMSATAGVVNVVMAGPRCRYDCRHP